MGGGSARSARPRAPGLPLLLLLLLLLVWVAAGVFAELGEVDLRACAVLLVVGGDMTEVVDAGGGRLGTCSPTLP